MNTGHRCLALATALCLSVGGSADEFERPPIDYSKNTPANRVSDLSLALDRGDAVLAYHETFGYLPALLDALHIPRDSQLLVFSKTSLQRTRISPKRPRAIYFNDDVYVGYCQKGEVLEISAVDTKLGAVFYTLEQNAKAKPRITRQLDNCLICHSSSRTEGVPGHLVRSLFVDGSGHPILSEGSYTVDHTTPLAVRWGGWYVTGQHGDQTHLGNLVFDDREVKRPVRNDAGINVTSLEGRIAVDRYLTPHSDIVALMVFEHQILVHNRLTKANYETRQALYYEASLRNALGEKSAQPFESTTRRIQAAGDDLVEALLMVKETPLTSVVKGTSGFAKSFMQRGRRDSAGRSLRDLDMQRRMFRFPCSYLIYSEAFDALPVEMRDYIWRRLWMVLVENADSQAFNHLSPADKRAIVEILLETKPGLPSYWKLPDQWR